MCEINEGKSITKKIETWWLVEGKCVNNQRKKIWDWAYINCEFICNGLFLLNHERKEIIKAGKVPILHVAMPNGAKKVDPK